MDQYLLRDGTQVTVAIIFDFLSYERASRQEVYVVLSVKTERAILNSLNLEPLFESRNFPVLKITLHVA